MSAASCAVRNGAHARLVNGRMPFQHDHPALLRLLEKASTATDELAAITEDL
jgi:hypothetical protein